jgi:hypothetical protein
VRARVLSLSLSLVSNQRPDRQTDDDDEEQKGKRERREKSGLCVSVYLFLWYLLDCGLWCTYGVSWRVKKQYVEGAKKKKLPPPNEQRQILGRLPRNGEKI